MAIRSIPLPAEQAAIDARADMGRRAGRAMRQLSRADARQLLEAVVVHLVSHHAGAALRECNAVTDIDKGFFIGRKAFCKEILAKLGLSTDGDLLP